MSTHLEHDLVVHKIAVCCSFKSESCMPPTYKPHVTPSGQLIALLNQVRVSTWQTCLLFVIHTIPYPCMSIDGKRICARVLDECRLQQYRIQDGTSSQIWMTKPMSTSGGWSSRCILCAGYSLLVHLILWDLWKQNFLPQVVSHLRGTCNLQQRFTMMSPCTRCLC